MPIAGDEVLHLNGKISWLSERVIIEPAYDFVSSLSSRDTLMPPRLQERRRLWSPPIGLLSKIYDS
jgi:hypothetical protein